MCTLYYEKRSLIDPVSKVGAMKVRRTRESLFPIESHLLTIVLMAVESLIVNAKFLTPFPSVYRLQDVYVSANLRIDLTFIVCWR